MRGCSALLLLAVPALCADWPAFRGPNSSGVGSGANLPVEMGPNKNVVWRTPLAPGHSSPVLVGGSIYLTGWEGDNLLTYRLDRETGKILWRRELKRPRRQELHKSNSPASPSPVSDGRNVFAFFTDFGLISYGPDGEERWRLPLGPFNNPFGMGASPLLVGDRLIMNCDSETDSFIVAVHKDSGKVLWRRDRPDVGRGFSTPILFHPPGGPAQALVAGSYQLTSYDVASGNPLWWVRGLTWQLKPTPVISGDTLFVLGWAGGSDEGNQEDLPGWEEILKQRDANRDGRLSRDEVDDQKLLRDWQESDLDKDGVFGERDWRMYQAKRRSLNAITAFRLGGEGDVTERNFLWRYTKSLPNAPSPLVYEGVVYLLKDGGVFTALDAKTGRVLKQGRIAGAMDPYYASPVAADGKIYTLSELGRLAVLKAGGDWEVLAVNDLDDACHATPALVDGRVYVRTRAALFAFARQ
jgi:outer membrane protein assembly factor BamB